METEPKIPKFRTLNGLVSWVRNKNIRDRLPAEREELFFKSNENDVKKSVYLGQYAAYVGKLSPELEELLVHDLASVVDYQCRIHREGHGLLPDHILKHLEGKDRLLVRLGRGLGRLPSWLEDTINEPKSIVDYAKYVVKDRLPSHMEERLVGDADQAVKYAFDVVRGFSSPRLSDLLHTFLIMKSFEVEHQGIRQYVHECSRKQTESEGIKA